MSTFNSTPNSTMLVENITDTSGKSFRDSLIMVPIGVRAPITTLVSLAIVFSNVINIIVLRVTKGIPEIAKMILINLSWADLMVGVTACVPSIATSIIGQWPYGIAWCQISASAHLVSSSVSVWSLTFVSIDRYIAIKRPLHYRQLVTRRRCIIILLFVWFMSAIIAMIPLFLSIPEFVYYQFNAAEVVCDFSYEYAWWCVAVILCNPLPSAIILVSTTVSIIRTTTRSSRGIARSVTARSAGQRVVGSDTRRNSIRKVEGIVTTEPAGSGKRPQHIQRNVHPESKQANSNKVILILVLTTTLYLIAWVPHGVKVILLSLGDNFHPPGWLEFTFMWIANSNSFVNVFIYSFIYPSFRNRAKLLITTFSMCRLGRLKAAVNVDKGDESVNK